MKESRGEWLLSLSLKMKVCKPSQNQSYMKWLNVCKFEGDERSRHPGGGGHSHWKVVWGHATLRPPFSCQILALETHLFKAFSHSGAPTWIFYKKHAFQAQFLLIFSSWDTIFRKILFRRPQFYAKKSVLETLFLKIFVTTPLPPGAICRFVFNHFLSVIHEHYSDIKASKSY